MKALLLLACLTFAAQGFAGQGIRQTVRAALKDSALIQKLATTHKVLPIAINSSNVERYMQSSQFLGKLRNSLSNTLVAGGMALILLSPSMTLAEESVTRKVSERDTTVEDSVTRKVSERETETVVEASSPSYTYHDYEKLMSTTRIGVSIAGADLSYVSDRKQTGVHFHNELLSANGTRIRSQLTMLMNTKAEFVGELNGGALIARGKLEIPLTDRDPYELTPVATGDLGLSIQDDSHLITDFIISLGFRIENNYLPPHHKYLSLRLGGGVFDFHDKYSRYSGKHGKHRNYRDTQAVFAMGADLHLPIRRTMGDLLELHPSAFLHMIPLIPDLDLEYSLLLSSGEYGYYNYVNVFRYDMIFTDVLSVDGEVIDKNSNAPYWRSADYWSYYVKLNLNVAGIF